MVTGGAAGLDRPHSSIQRRHRPQTCREEPTRGDLLQESRATPAEGTLLTYVTRNIELLMNALIYAYIHAFKQTYTSPTQPELYTTVLTLIYCCILLHS